MIFVSLLFVNYLIGQELFIQGGGTLNDWANLSRYKEENNKPRALRISFKNSSDFIGWYFWKTNKINKISFTDTRNMYLNYYLGWQGYKNEIYKKDKNSIIFAKSVEKQAKIYKNQLQECKTILNKSYIIE